MNSSVLIEKTTDDEEIKYLIEFNCSDHYVAKQQEIKLIQWKKKKSSSSQLINHANGC